MWDVFFSYRRHDLDRAQPLLEELARAGVSVWRDEIEISEQASITSAIREAIASCKVFLAFILLHIREAIHVKRKLRRPGSQPTGLGNPRIVAFGS